MIWNAVHSILGQFFFVEIFCDLNNSFIFDSSILLIPVSLVALWIFYALLGTKQNKIPEHDSKVLKTILNQVDKKYINIINNPEKYKFQLMYTKIDRDKNNQPEFTSHSFGIAPEKVTFISLVKSVMTKLNSSLCCICCLCWNRNDYTPRMCWHLYCRRCHKRKSSQSFQRSTFIYNRRNNLWNTEILVNQA